MSTHNMGFYEDLTKISLNYHQISSNTLLIYSAECSRSPLLRISVTTFVENDMSRITTY